MRVGYIGSATDGAGLAARLHSPHPVLIYDPAPSSDGAPPPFMEPTAMILSEPGAVAVASDVVLIRLDSAAAVREALFGDGGVAAAARAGTLIIDQSPGDPATTRAAATTLASRQISLIDAPALPAADHDARIIVAVGGSEQEFATAQPILEATGAHAEHAGEIGSGLVVKAAHSLISAMLRCAVIEALALADRSGLQLSAALGVLMAGSGQNAYVRTAAHSGSLAGPPDAGVPIGSVYADVAAACELAARSGVPLFVGNTVRAFYQACLGELGPQADADSAGTVIDHLAGTHVTAALAARQPEGHASHA